MREVFKDLIESIRVRPLLIDTLKTTMWSSIGKGSGFVIPFFLARWFGISSETDAFFFVYSIIIFLSVILAPVIESVIVPFVIELREDKGLQVFVGGVIGLGFFCSVAMVLIIVAFSEFGLRYITRFDHHQVILIQALLVKLSPLVTLTVLASIISGILNAFKYFTLPALSPLFRAIVNLTIILFLKDKIGIHSVAIGYVIGELARFIILLSKAIKLNLIGFNSSFNLFNKRILHFGKVSLYQSIGMAILGLNPIIDKAMASWLQVGSVSMLEYAGRLYIIPEAFLSAGLMVTILSHWSERYQEYGILRLDSDIRRTLRWVGFFCLFLTILIVALSPLLVRLLFLSEKFDSRMSGRVCIIWIILMVGFIPNMLGRIYMRAHIILKNTKVLLLRGVASVIIHVLCNLLLMRKFGVNGIAVSSVVAAFFYFFYIRAAFHYEITKR